MSIEMPDNHLHLFIPYALCHIYIQGNSNMYTRGTINSAQYISRRMKNQFEYTLFLRLFHFSDKQYMCRKHIFLVTKENERP